MPKGDLGEPVGAIWIKNWKLKDSIIRFIEEKRCSHCQSAYEVDVEGLNEAVKAHTLAVKVKSLKEKFLAIENTRKKDPKQPDYFLHVYQTHTGAAPSYPFGID